MKMIKQIRMKIFFAWTATILLFALLSFLAMSLDLKILQCIEVTSSWGTLACIVVLGTMTALLVARRSKSNSILISVAYSAIFICYAGYVTMGFDSLAPEISAIGFNIATILQCVSIWKVARMSK